MRLGVSPIQFANWQVARSIDRACPAATERRVCFPQLHRAPSDRRRCLVVRHTRRQILPIRSPPQLTTQLIVAHSHPVGNSIISESRLDRDARDVRQELLKRKRARDLHRRKQGEQAEDMLRRFVATDSKAKGIRLALKASFSWPSAIIKNIEVVASGFSTGFRANGMN